MDNNAAFARIQESPIVIALTEEQIRKFREAGVVEKFPDGATIVRKDTPGDALYIILDGRVFIEGEHETPLATLSGEATMQEQYEGDFFGEMAVLDYEPRSASVVSVGETTLFRVGREDLFRLFAEDVEFQVVLLTNIVRTLSRRLRRTSLKVQLYRSLSQKNEE